MGNFVTQGAMLQCSFGMSPCTLVVTVPARPKCMNMLMAVTTDFTVTNIPSFGMCQSLSNPTVSSATSAAMGVLTPMPCVPVISSPWSPGSSQVKVGGIAALTDNSKCMCSYGGNISIASPGNTMVTGK